MSKRLKTEIIDLAYKSILLREEIAKKSRKKKRTVRDWFRTNKPDNPLTKKANLELISKYLNVPESKILEDVGELNES